jgi:chromosome segregation protein
MLQRLELIGFKSFADKTVFEFSPGITAIVGPNGSGKSNIIDAVRWVLGEQSIKSLRGQDMVDVIFNGSTGRRSLGLAQVTMAFNNQKRTLATDKDEVQITRRVYRDGQSEYLLNQELCRLKDIKELFLGSGAGSDAYSIIEQGRVDVLLQASTKDRRAIFEEAAGISRFKSKKIETLRKLERVDQNVQRLRDILDEVEKQLRAVQLQAAKVERFQEHQGRLKELRVGLVLREFHQLTEQWQTEQALLVGLRAELEKQSALGEDQERRVRQLEDEDRRLEAMVREREAQLTRAHQRIAADESTLEHERNLSEELEADLGRTRRRRAELTTRLTGLADAAADAAQEWQRFEIQCREQEETVLRLEERLKELASVVSALQSRIQIEKAAHFEEMRQAARRHNDAVSYKAHMDNLSRERDRLRQKSEQASGHLALLDGELDQLSEAEQVLQARLSAARQALSGLRDDCDRLRQSIEATGTLASELRAQRSGLASRIEVLEGLERSQEGVDAGPREVVALLAAANSVEKANEPGSALARALLGMVADRITVKREYAHLIDLALGQTAQSFLVRESECLDEGLRQWTQSFASRVRFVPLQGGATSQSEGRATPLVGQPGVVVRAVELVSCEDPALAELPRQLLGSTLVVTDLPRARELSRQLPGWRFVTLKGELLEADGALTVGTHHAESGILSRKSELRARKEQGHLLDQCLEETERDLAELQQRLAVLEAQTEKRLQEIEVLGEQSVDLSSRVARHRQRRDGLHEEVTLSRTEIDGLDGEIQGQERAWQQARGQAEASEQQVRTLEACIAQAEQEIRERTVQSQQLQQETTAAKVLLAQSEERRKAFRARHLQIAADLQARRQEGEQCDQHLALTHARWQQSQATILAASAIVAACCLDKESAERALLDLRGQREKAQQERQALAELTQMNRQEWQSKREQIHDRELEFNNLRLRREGLVERSREEFQLDLLPLYQQFREAGTRDTVEDPAAVQEEIAELKRKLARLGSVNLDAVQELADLQSRAGALQTQFDDLTAAKRALEDIIAKINGDSRRLFSETFGAIRAHFQELFRKLFGGGMADIVLEDENDILECGIEIIARPPGKETRNLSLMSGGEKTLTAVALLLAIFRSKPSPFCILDEVDAALDEANVGRFTAVLREFLDQSQFILVTHSKRTMAAADVLYGITMQESGVSSRMAVRFEDWHEESEPVQETRLAA